jgi:hypothetical protein
MRRDLAHGPAEILGFSEISVHRRGTDKRDLVGRRQRLHHQFAHHFADPRCNTSIATQRIQGVILLSIQAGISRRFVVDPKLGWEPAKGNGSECA